MVAGMVNKKLTQTTPQPTAASARKTAARAKADAAAAKPVVKPAAPKAATQPARRPTARPGTGAASRLDNVKRGFRETIAELRKVQWPDRLTTRNLTLVVIGMSAALAAVLGGVDAILTWLIKWLVQL
jgi:preprotein translocase SecE subunit